MGKRKEGLGRRPRCVRCLVLRASHSCSGPLCGPCRSVYNRVYVENLQRVKLLYIDIEEYFAALDTKSRSGGREYLGKLPEGPVPDPPGDVKSAYAPFRRRAELRLMLSTIHELSIDTERLQESLSSATSGEDYDLLAALEQAGYSRRQLSRPAKLYAGNIRTVALAWPLSKYNLEARFERLVRKGCLDHITDPPLEGQIDFASGKVGVWHASNVEDFPDLDAIPTPEEILRAAGKQDTEGVTEKGRREILRKRGTEEEADQPQLDL